TTMTLDVLNRTITNVGHIHFQVASPPGQAMFTWELQMGGFPAACTQTEVVNFDFGGGLVFQNITCSTMQALLTDIPIGVYNVTATLVEPGVTQPESQSPPISLTIASGQTANGGHIIFVTN